MSLQQTSTGWEVADVDATYGFVFLPIQLLTGFENPETLTASNARAVDADGNVLFTLDILPPEGEIAPNGYFGIPEGAFDAIGYSGEFSIVVDVTDAEGNSATGQSQTAIAYPGNTAPPQNWRDPLFDFADVNVGDTVTITEAELLVGIRDFSRPGDFLPGDDIAGVQSISVSNGDLVDNGDGTYTFTATSGGEAVVTYTVADNDGNVSQPIVNSFEVAGSAGPSITGTAAQTLGNVFSTNVTEYEGRSVSAGGYFEVNSFLVGWSDPQVGQTNKLDVTSVSSANGTWQFSEGFTEAILPEGNQTYVADNNRGWFFVPNNGFTGTETVTYTVTDADGNESTGTVSLEVADFDPNGISYTNGDDYFSTNFSFQDRDQGSTTIVEGEAYVFGESFSFDPNPRQFGYADISNRETPLEVVGYSALNGTIELGTTLQFNTETFTNDVVPAYNYTANEGYIGVDQIAVTYRDADGNESVRYLSVEVLERNSNIQSVGDFAAYEAYNQQLQDATTPADAAFNTASGDFYNQFYGKAVIDQTDSTSYLINTPFNQGTADITDFPEGYVSPSVAGLDDWNVGEAVTFQGADLLAKYTTLDGSALSIGDIGYSYFDNTLGQPVSGQFEYDAATDTYSTPSGLNSQAITIRFNLDDGSGVLSEQDVFLVDFEQPSAGPVVEKGVEGEDYLYFSQLAEIRDNDRLVKRGEDEITGNYWVNSRDSSTNDNFVDGGEYATIIGRRGELTADLTADEIIGGLESGDFVASKSYTSYGGYVVSSAFADGEIDALVQSTGGEFNQLTISRIDANTGELVTGFGGDFRNVSGTEIFGNFDPSRTLSGRNDNAFGDILAAQNEQTGGF